jgi:hypothetical protein
VRYGAWNALHIIEKTEDVDREKCYVQKYTNQDYLYYKCELRIFLE